MSEWSRRGHHLSFLPFSLKRPTSVVWFVVGLCCTVETRRDNKVPSGLRCCSMLEYGKEGSFLWVSLPVSARILASRADENPRLLFRVSKTIYSLSLQLFFYVPQARKLVFPLRLRVTECCLFRYRGIQCKNWTAHAHIVLQRNTIFFLFFFFLSLLLRTALATYWQSLVDLNCACVYWNPLLLYKIDKIEMAGTSRDISIVMTSTGNNYNTRLDSSVRIKTRTKVT